jgi:hypothetical protein
MRFFGQKLLGNSLFNQTSKYAKYTKGAIVSAENKTPQHVMNRTKTCSLFAIRFNVTLEIAFVSRRRKIEHEMAQKQKIPQMAILEWVRER